MSLPTRLGRRSPLLGASTLAVVALIAAGCAADESGSVQGSASAATQGSDQQNGGGAERYPNVVEVELTELGGGEYTVATTLSSPYDSPDRYADAWRVLDSDGNQLGVRELAHDHADEQPFTRSETIEIPDDVDEVTVEGRDQISGYGGATVTVEVPRGP